MANRGYLSGPHRLLPGYSSLAASRAGVGSGSNSRASPPEFSYDAFPRSASGGGGARDGAAYNRAPPSPANSALSMAYSGVSEFPYGLSGVQMPTYNFGSELYNYVSNGFPRKSRMCTFCNKVFTRSTTRRYHERRCPLLRASNSLAKSEENSTAAAAAAAAALKEHQHRQKEAVSAITNPAASTPRTANTSLASSATSPAGSNQPSAPTPASPPPPSLHPAYPTSFPPTSVLGSSPSRSAAAVYNYAHSYGSHFYNSISAAALASLDQNSNTLQSKKESDSTSWTSSPSPSSKLRDHNSSSSILGSSSSLSKSFAHDSGVDLTARYCADFSIRSQPPVFPPTSLRGMPRSPPSPEPGETKPDLSAMNNRRGSTSPQDFARTPGRDREWSSPNREKNDYPDKITVANISGARLKTTSSSPPPMLWNNKVRMERAQEQYMQVQPVDDDEEEEDDEEEDEEEVEEDEEQFNETLNHNSEGDDGEKRSESDSISTPLNKSSSYNPLVCQFCKKAFSDTITRQAHEALHSQTKSYACSLCSHAFHCAYSLRIHLLRHHIEGPYKCKQCSETFSEIMALKSHLLTQHSLPKQETCSLKYFSLLDNSDSSSGLQYSGVSDGEQDAKEKNNSHSQRRSADSLPDVLNDSDQTTKNRRTNELEEPVANGGLTNEETEVCKICNKAFAKSFIRFHERAHADQKPYECPICNKRFGYKNNMKSHMKLHQGLKPYQCQICGARFTRGSTLRRHGRRHNISRNAMLDYVLYDHSAGPTRAIGVGGKTNMAATTHATAAAVAAAAAASSQYAQHNRITSADQQIGKSLGYAPHARPPHPPTTTNLDNERYGSAGRRTPPRTSPMSSVSPRGASNHLTTQAMTSPMVGGLAAVAAANLFAYPAAAAPHLYQFYASTNQLMSYSAYASNHSGTQAVQSDALNLSLGKRKSPSEDDENRSKEKLQRRDSGGYDRESPNKQAYDKKENSIKIETEEPGEMIKSEGSNPFTSSFSPKKERLLHTPLKDQHSSSYDNKEDLKISTEDFAAQVNICCPSPLVQSSTGSLHHQSSAGSPVGSSSCNESNVQAHASPSGISHHSSPANSANSAPSPSNMSENHLQELLLSLLTSGRMFRCSFCDIYFTEYAMFRLHQKYHQCDIARPFLCSVCGEDCKDKTYFTVHLSEHLGLGSKSGIA